MNLAIIAKKLMLFYLLFFSQLLFGINLNQSSFVNYDSNVTFNGTYTLPIESDLKSFATWKLSMVKWIQNKNYVSVTYKMPEDLVKEKESLFTLTGTIVHNSPFVLLKSESAKAQCTPLKSGDIICIVRFTNIEPILQIEAFFQNQYKDTKESTSRIQVAKMFSFDPIGIIHIIKNP